jgi:riboflavin kinase / FMN adenylyltransferase
VFQDAVASLVYRPTFDGTSFLIEVHLFDAEVDLYGERLVCAFIERLRPEERFASADALIRQMDRDALSAREILAARPA